MIYAFLGMACAFWSLRMRLPSFQTAARGDISEKPRISHKVAKKVKQNIAKGSVSSRYELIAMEP